VCAEQASLHWELRASGLSQRQSRDGKITPHWGSQGNVPVIALYPNEVFVSIVVGTPFHLYEKEENLSLTGLAGFVSAEATVKSVRWSYDCSSRQNSD